MIFLYITIFSLAVLALLLYSDSDSSIKSEVQVIALVVIMVFESLIIFEIQSLTEYETEIVRKYQKGEYQLHIEVDKEKCDTTYHFN